MAVGFAESKNALIFVMGVRSGISPQIVYDAPMKITQRYPQLDHLYERFLKIRGNPHEISLGVGVGFFVGMTPFLGVHVILAVFVAALFKWNKIAAGIGAWITNPITAPFIYGLNWYVGAKVTGMELTQIVPVNFGVNELMGLMKEGPEILRTLLIGGIVTGVPLAMAGYFLTRLALKRFRSNHKP